MKKVISLAIVFILMVTTGCSSSQKSTATKSPVYPKSIAFDDYDGRRDIRDKNQIDNDYKKAFDGFSYSSASKILSVQSKNISYSPVSLYMTLSLAAAGANGSTKEEIFSALGLAKKSKDYLSQQNGNLFRLLYCDNEIAKLKIANSLWLQKDINFKSSFTDNAVQNFYASLYNINFSDRSTAQQMSKWISDNTNGVLSPEITVDPEEIMSIINTIYFKDEWVDKFNESDTKPDTFNLSNGDKVKCDFMNSSYSTHSFVRGDGFISSSLSLKNSGSMMFILPDKGVSIEDLTSTPEKTALLFSEKDAKWGKVVFKIPKFSFGSSLDLKDTLKNMGIKSAFENNADFTGITDNKAFISSIKQQTHIAIDEKGVEAAAFTQIVYAGAAPPKDEIAEVILDRPFIFAVKAERDNILFIGVINNPTEKSS